MAQGADYHQYLERGEKRLVRLLQEMVRVPTTNPPGHHYREMVELLKGCCERLGMKAQVHRVPDELVQKVTGSAAWPRYNLVARWEAGKAQTAHFNAHYDVVPTAGQWKFGSPFEPGLSGDWLYGRGSGDMKGSIAALLMAIEALQESGSEPACNVECSFTADEETGGELGAGYVVRQGLVNAHFAVVCEGASGAQVGCGHNGVLWLEVELLGKSAHASRPQEGVNAFEAMAGVVGQLQDCKKKLAEVRRQYRDFDGQTRQPTLNIGGVFAGGEGDKVNTVPARAAFSLDRRVLPTERISQVEGELRRAVERAASRQRRVQCRIRAPLRIAPCVVQAGHSLPRSFARAVQAVRRRSASFRVTTGFTDLHYFVEEGGLPGIGYGAKGEHAHGVDERVRVRDLVLTARTYAEFMRRGIAEA
jgi:succinyl-diaminopimelate desuccinylase